MANIVQMQTYFSIDLTDVCDPCVVVVQYHYAIEEDSEGDNDSEEFYYGGQVSKQDVNATHCMLSETVYLIPVCEVHVFSICSLRLGCAPFCKGFARET